MKNYRNIRNIFNILGFFINDTFHGVFKNPFFRKKRNRYLFFTLLFILYLYYFYLNTVQFSKQSNALAHIPNSKVLFLSKITLASYYNSILVFSLLIFILVNTTIHLTNKSLFMIKVLPFTKNEVQSSIKLFKSIAGLFFFELLLIVITPFLKILPVHWLIFIIIVISFHTVFLCVLSLLDMLYKMLIAKKKGKYKWLLDTLLSILAIVYYITLRFQVDDWIARVCNINTLPIVILFVSVTIILIIHQIENRYPIDNTFIESRFVKYKIVPRKFLNLISAAFIRSKNFITISILVFIASILLLIQTPSWETLEALLFLLPLISVSLISYGDATHLFRPFYRFFHITPYFELIKLLLYGSILNIPLLLIGIICNKGIDPFLYAMTIMVSSLIFGFLFPKSLSNINETVSAILSILMLVVLSLLVNMKGVLLAVLFILTIVLYGIQKKEFEVRK